MTHFQIFGRLLTFRLVCLYVNPVGTHCVYGITLDGKRQTTARLVDVIAVDANDAAEG